MPRSFKTNGMFLGEERPVSFKGTGHYDFPYRYLFLFLTILSPYLSYTFLVFSCSE